MIQHVLAPLRRLRRNDEGTASVEAVMWLPVFFVFFSLVADVALIFYNQNQVHRLVQDANRRLSVGRLESAAATETYLLSALATRAPRATVSVDMDTNPGIVASTVVLKSGDLVATGLFNGIADIDLIVHSQHLIEY